MKMTIRPMTDTETLYSYNQSSQIEGQTGCIGHLRGYVGSDGDHCSSSWETHQERLHTPEFKTELDEVLHTLRCDMGYDMMLRNRKTLARYCYHHPDYKFGRNEFGYRVDTKDYSYLLRLNPGQRDYNIYCYCYRKDWLDRHIRRASQGICFITSNYKELFRIQDGGQIRVITNRGEILKRTIRYIDETHVEVGNNLYHICQFAELMEKNGNRVEPVGKDRLERREKDRGKGETR